MAQSLPRVLITVDRWYREASGGARKLAGRFAEWLAAEGHEVDLVAGIDPQAATPASPHPRLALHFYRNPTAPSPSLANLRAHRRATEEIVVKLLRSHPYGLHHGHIPLNFLGATDAPEARSRIARHVYTVHSPYAHELRAQWEQSGITLKRRLALVLARRLEDTVVKRADGLHVLSDFTRSLVPIPKRKPADFVMKLPGAIQLPESEVAAPGAELMKWLGERPTFLTIRRLEARMGLENLLAACAQLRDERRNFALLIAGNGSSRAALRELRNELKLRNHVKFLGFVPDAELEGIYRTVRCGILPSTGLECFGLTILEAHLRGLPLIATPIGAIPETIGSENRAWLTRDTSAEALAERMRAVLDKQLPPARDRLERRAREFLEPVVFARWREAFLSKSPDSAE
jgi:glycosyltransferase involved in cell wall biosynthesis